MKNLIISIFAALIGICCLGIVCVISGKDARQMELNSNVGNAVEGTVSHCMENLGTETDQRIFLADAVTAAVCELHTDSEVSVRIWGADEKKGLLGMEVEEMFRYPNGRKGKAARSRIVILDREKEKKGSHTVKFYRNKAEMQEDADCYKSYVVADGEKIKEPREPQMEGMIFEGWHDINDYIADFSQEVQEDIVYYGAWEE
mgnify:FL=1